MKNINQYIIPLLLIILSIGPALGFAGMGNSNVTEQKPSFDLNNSTQSDRDIDLIQHLIEIDAAQFASENKILVRESFFYRNRGTMNFSGTLRTWVPDGTIGIVVLRMEMRANAPSYQIAAGQEGNIVSWQDFIGQSGQMPPLYIVQYLVPSEPEGTITTSRYYSKKILYPTQVTKKPFSLLIKVTGRDGESITITDEKGNSITASGNPTEAEDDSFLYRWDAPQFTEINIKISKTGLEPARVAGYVIPGILILSVIFYPYIRKKSEHIRNIEEKLRSSLERGSGEEAGETEEIEEEPAEAVEKDAREAVSPGETQELENQRNEVLSKLRDLEKEYSSGNLLDEEYEELRESLKKDMDKIDERIKQPGAGK